MTTKQRNAHLDAIDNRDLLDNEARALAEHLDEQLPGHLVTAVPWHFEHGWWIATVWNDDNGSEVLFNIRRDWHGYSWFRSKPSQQKPLAPMSAEFDDITEAARTLIGEMEKT